MGAFLFLLGWTIILMAPTRVACNRAQVTDKGIEHLIERITSLVTLNVIGCHRLTPKAKMQVRRIHPCDWHMMLRAVTCQAQCSRVGRSDKAENAGAFVCQVARLLDNPFQS